MSADLTLWSSEAWNSAADIQLLAEAREGSTEAYAELWRRHLPAAYSVANRFRGRAAAEDVVAEASARVFALIQDGAGPQENFRSYFLSAVKSVAVDGARRDLKVVPAPDEDLETLSEPVPHAADVDLIDSDLIRTAFQGLPERDQRVLWHTTVEGEAPRVIAPLLGMTPNTVSARASRAREALRANYLDAHASRRRTGGESLECGWTIEHLGAHVRGRLPKRQNERVNAHLEECHHAAAIAADLRAIHEGFPVVVAPLVFLAGVSVPGFLTGSALAGLGASGAAGAAGAAGTAASLTGEGADGAASGGGSAGAAAGGAPGTPGGPSTPSANASRVVDAVASVASRAAVAAAGVAIAVGAAGGGSVADPAVSSPLPVPGSTTANVAPPVAAPPATQTGTTPTLVAPTGTLAPVGASTASVQGPAPGGSDGGSDGGSGRGSAGDLLATGADAFGGAAAGRQGAGSLGQAAPNRPAAPRLPSPAQSPSPSSPSPPSPSAAPTAGPTIAPTSTVVPPTSAPPVAPTTAPPVSPTTPGTTPPTSTPTTTTPPTTRPTTPPTTTPPTTTPPTTTPPTTPPTSTSPPTSTPPPTTSPTTPPPTSPTTRPTTPPTTVPTWTEPTRPPTKTPTLTTPPPRVPPVSVEVRAGHQVRVTVRVEFRRDAGSGLACDLPSPWIVSCVAWPNVPFLPIGR